MTDHPLDTLDAELPEGHKSGFVTIIGRPNVGKSTLLNAFLEQKIAIVTARPQTTRQRQLGIITDPNYQMIFIDTPGIMKTPRHKLDTFMLETAVDTLTDADVVLWLVDSTQRPGAESRALAEKLQNLPEESTLILALNKIDILSIDQVLPRSEAYRALLPTDTPWIFFSAKEGNGRSELFQMLVDALPQGPRYYPADQVTETYVRDIAAELIREQLMLQLQEELPYSVAVGINEFKERDNGSIYVNANIYVERDSHKRIIIGSNGAQIRKLGAAARQQIEELTGSKVFLELWVKVSPKWRRNEQSLKQFGYSHKT